jgi:hypothetical protein
MASPDLGYIGRCAYSVGGHQLLATEDVLRYLQVWDCFLNVGFSPQPYLAPDWCLEDVWFPLCQGSLHYDLYVPVELSFSVPKSHTWDPRQRNWRAGWLELDPLLVCI